MSSLAALSAPADMRHDFWLPLLAMVFVIVAIIFLWRATRVDRE